MSHSPHDLDLVIDSDGLPVLTELVPEQDLQAAQGGKPRMAGMSIADIANDLLDSEVFQRQLDDISRDLSRNIRLQLEQALGIALENVVNEALEHNKLRSFELIRQQLEGTLPVLLAKIIQDEEFPV